MLHLAHAIGFGLVTAGILGLAAAGLALQVSVTNFINFAYGDFLALGGYFGLTARQHHVNIYSSTVLAMLGVSVFSWLIYELVYGPLQRRGMKVISLLIVSLGMSLALESAISIVWSSTQQTFGLTAAKPFHVGPFLMTGVQLEIIAFAVLALLALEFLLRFTKLGKAMRAMSSNMDLARASGIATDALTGVVWAIMGLLAGLAGVMLALTISAFTPSYGFNFLFLIFAVVIIGGIGRVYGALLGAVIIGVGLSIAQAYLAAQYADAIVFAVLIGVLLVKPQGIFGGKLVAQ